MIIGISTCCVCSDLVPVSPRLLDSLRQLGCNAVEFSSVSELAALEKYGSELVAGFQFASIHAPTDITYANDRPTRDLLERLCSIQLSLNLDSIVLHPDIVQDWNLLRESGLPFAVENMDHNKSFGKSVEDIVPILDCYDFRFVLDVNHVFTNDPSMVLASRFCSELGPRLSHVHLSGFESLHDPLFRTDQAEIVAAVPANTPIILESILVDIGELAAELQYVKNHLSITEA